MAQLFIPMLVREATQEESLFWKTEEANLMDHIGHELLTNMQRFTSQVSFYLNSIRKKISFTIYTLNFMLYNI